jgi:hypothetical protein
MVPAFFLNFHPVALGRVFSLRQAKEWISLLFFVPPSHTGYRHITVLCTFTGKVCTSMYIVHASVLRIPSFQAANDLNSILPDNDFCVLNDRNNLIGYLCVWLSMGGKSHTRPLKHWIPLWYSRTVQYGTCAVCRVRGGVCTVCPVSALIGFWSACSLVHTHLSRALPPCQHICQGQTTV